MFRVDIAWNEGLGRRRTWVFPSVPLDVAVGLTTIVGQWLRAAYPDRDYTIHIIDLTATQRVTARTPTFAHSHTVRYNT